MLLRLFKIIPELSIFQTYHLSINIKVVCISGVGRSKSLIYKPKKITIEEARLSGIELNFEEMENGEKRYRLLGSDGSSYCRTEGSENGGWQNSHFHKFTTELYIVQSGWIAYAEMDQKGEFQIRILNEGDIIQIEPYIHHNIFMSTKSIIHTIKYGNSNVKTDWFPAKSLDQYTKQLSSNDLLKINNSML